MTIAGASLAGVNLAGGQLKAVGGRGAPITVGFKKYLLPLQEIPFAIFRNTFMLVLIIYFFVGESATVAAAEGAAATATFPKAVGRWKSESGLAAGGRWQGGQQKFQHRH